MDLATSNVASILGVLRVSIRITWIVVVLNLFDIIVLPTSLAFVSSG